MTLVCSIHLQQLFIVIVKIEVIIVVVGSSFIAL